MEFTSVLKRFFIFFFQLLAVGIWLLFFYFKLWDFANAAITLKSINVQTVSYLAYSILLFFLTAAFLYSPNYSREKLFRRLGYAFSVIFVIGATGDLITYHFFKGYSFIVGDAIFCNIVFGIPNIYGVLCCYVIAVLYALFGIYLVKDRLVAYFMYLSIMLISIVPSYAYSYFFLGGYPRKAWVEKAAFIIPIQLCIFIALTISVISQTTSEENID